MGFEASKWVDHEEAPDMGYVLFEGIETPQDFREALSNFYIKTIVEERMSRIDSFDEHEGSICFLEQPYYCSIRVDLINIERKSDTLYIVSAEHEKNGDAGMVYFENEFIYEDGAWKIGKTIYT